AVQKALRKFFTKLRSFITKRIHRGKTAATIVAGRCNMQMKGPFKLTKENIDHVPAKAGVVILADDADKVLYWGKSDRDLTTLLNEVVVKQIPATRFWYWDTWSREKARSLAESLGRKYSTAKVLSPCSANEGRTATL